MKYLEHSEVATLRKLNDRLAETNNRLLRAQEIGGLCWWEYNSINETLTWSPMVPKMLGLPENSTPSFSLMTLYCHEDDLKHLNEVHRYPSNLVGKFTSYRIRLPDGTIRWIQEVIDHGSSNRTLGVLRDVTHEKILEERLRRESVIDELTGLYSRKQFNIDLKSHYSECLRHGKNLALVIYDFDHFKKINDRYGHLMGDKVLKESAKIITDQLRASDRAYRLGGEEFAIFLGSTNEVDAEKLCERLRQSIEKNPFTLNGLQTRATVSLGVSRFVFSDTSFEDIFKRADEALYQSKSRSRNTTTSLI